MAIAVKGADGKECLRGVTNGGANYTSEAKALEHLSLLMGEVLPSKKNRFFCGSDNLYDIKGIKVEEAKSSGLFSRLKNHGRRKKDDK